MRVWVRTARLLKKERSGKLLAGFATSRFQTAGSSLQRLGGEGQRLGRGVKIKLPPWKFNSKFSDQPLFWNRCREAGKKTPKPYFAWSKTWACSAS
jgi:hypothetical protein